MSRLLEKTLSSNYLAYCSMLKTIDQSLEEKKLFKNYVIKLKKIIKFFIVKKLLYY